MRATFAPIALAALAAANPMPQGVTAQLKPSSAPPAGCSSSSSGSFEIELLKVGSSKRAIEARDNILVAQIKDGVMTDEQGRIGSIVANGQFQFDGPPAQEGAIYTAGWSLCPNGTVTLGGETTFYQCLSGTFYNIYDMSIGGQCSPVYIQAINKKSVAASQYFDGQVQATGAVSQTTDGQVQATGAVSQYTDGQPQAPTGNPVSQYTDGQPQGPTGTPISQYSDGQPQAPTGMPVSQYSDGQPQAPTGMPVSQYSDGQPQAPTGMPVSQYSDGQPQAPTGNPVSQYSDGQPQAPTATPTRPASNMTMGMSTGGMTKPTSAPSPIPATGAAVMNIAGYFTVAAGVFAAICL